MFSASKTAGPSGYNLTNSLRFRSSASAYLSRTPASAGNRRTYTWSAWVKRGALNGGGTDMCLFNAGTTSPTYDGFRIKSDTISFFQGGAVSVNIESTQVFRDPSAWYHFVLAVDTTQATSSNRVKIYVNGNQITAFGTANYPAQNAEASINNTLVHNIAAQYANTSSSAFFDGYMDEINFIDGQALTPSSFGSTNSTTGVWQPARYAGTYGTNGFYLNFTDIALTSGSNAGLGKDFSGNGNFWNTNNISVTAGSTYDAMIDSPTLTSATVANYAVMNPLGNAVGNAPATLTEGNLRATNSATSFLGALGTIGLPTSGKFYWEIQLTQNSGPSNLSTFGIAPSNVPLNGNQANFANSVQWYIGNNTLIQLPVTGTVTAVSGGSTTSDVFQICYDGSTGKVYFGRNNTFYNSAGAATGNPSSGTNETATLTTGDLLPWFFAYQEGATFNFGQRPFSYTPPTGFVRLNTFNLPNSTVVKGNTVMDATLYAGNNTGQTITNAGAFRPDFLWIKVRTNTYDHTLADSVRGVSAFLASNTTAAEGTNSELTSFNSNGFTLGATGSMARNVSGQNYVAWQWQAGQGSTSSNTSGTITSTVSVNATAGFSVVTYTGTGVAATIGHGLGVAPKFIIVKRRNASGDYWVCYHASIGATKGIYLNTTDAAGTSDLWNDTAPTSTVFSVKTTSGVNASGGTYVGYCWAEIAGFSKFTSYVGNGSADGPFVYCGFRPKYVMYKDTANGSTNWEVVDSARNTTNPEFTRLFPNQSNADDNGVNPVMDFTANGFKIRTSAFGANNNGNTHIVMAFAENPLKNSLAR